MSDVFEHLDEVVDRLARQRDELLGDEFAPDRAAGLAVVFDAEARAWSQLFELSSLRLVWRAALAAEAGARANAARWAAQAARDRVGAVPVESWAAGRVGAPRPAALTTSSTRGVVGDGQRGRVALVRGAGRRDLREGAGAGRGGGVLADRVAAVRIDSVGPGAAGGRVGVRLNGRRRDHPGADRPD